MTNDIKVSVILTVYNLESYLRQCLDCICNQTLKDIEIICVDDSSTDDSYAILEKYAKKDSRIKVVRQEHMGAGKARNKGISLAVGEYLSILDGDDFFEPDMLEKAYENAKDNEADIVVFRSDLFDQKEKAYRENNWSIIPDKLPEAVFCADDIPDRIFNIGAGWAWDKLFKRSFTESYDVSFQDLRTTNDMFFVLYLYTRAKRISFLDSVLAHQRINNKESLSSTREESWDNVFFALKELKSRLEGDGVYETYRQSFVNWALNLLLWHIRTLKKEQSDKLKDKCKQEYFDTLDISGNGRDYFYDKKEFEAMEEIMDGPAKVSVIVPVYNGSAYLHQCLDSICSQTLRNIEIICVDDGSTDNSLDILNGYAERDHRLYVIEKEHSNAGDARNAGMEAAVGEYLSFLDADDYFEPDMLETVYDQAKEEDSDVCLFRSDRFDQKTGEYEDAPWTLRDREMPVHRPFSAHDAKDKIFNMSGCTAWDKLFRREFILKNSVFFQSNSSVNDMLFTFTALALAEKISVAEDVLAHMRVKHTKYFSKEIEYCTSCYAEALLKLKDSLTERGIYEEFKRSYVNWALDFCLYIMNEFEGVFSDLIRQQLKLRFFEELDIYGTTEEDFYDPDQYKEMMKIMSERQQVKSDDTPKVSVILPVYNVAHYLPLALDSAVYQTLEEIEIICVNDGSTDNSLDIIKEYAQKDSRIKVINGPNKGYGHAMNTGIKAAKGEYIGIIEPDDFVDVNMYKDLYETARENDLDFIKSDFNRFVHDGLGKIIFTYNKIALDDDNYDRVICPREEQKVFTFVMNTWSGIYKRDFLNKHGIDHNETPGASFQDNGFWFKTNMWADRAMFCGDAYYLNRRDNPDSSVKDKGKVYCANKEYVLLYKYLEKTDTKKEFLDVYNLKLMHNYDFTLQRIAPELRKEYLCSISEEFKELSEKGEFKSSFWTPTESNKAIRIKNDPLEYYYCEIRDMVKVSVILPVYNGAAYIRQCLDSLLAQSLKEIEIICINDGSTDDTLAILKEYSKRDARIRIIDQENAGAGAARNKGIEIAEGKYLSFLDADDYFDRDMLKSAYQRSIVTGSDICIYKAYLYDEPTGTKTQNTFSVRQQELPKREVFSRIDMKYSIFHSLMGWAWDKLYKRSFVLNNDLRFQEQRTTNDMCFVFTSLFKASKITILDKYLYYQRRNNPSSLSNTRELSWECFYKALVRIREELVSMGIFEIYERDYVNYALHSCLWNLNSLKEPVAEKLFHILRNEWFGELGIDGRDEDYFDNKGEYGQYKNMIRFPENDKEAYRKYKENALVRQILNRSGKEMSSVRIRDKSGESITLKELVEKFIWEDRFEVTINEKP